MRTISPTEDLTVPHYPTDLSMKDELKDKKDTDVQGNELIDRVFEASITSCTLNF